MGAFKLFLGGLLGWVGFKRYINTAKLPVAAAQSFEEICLQAGYALETHFVRTEDGYVLRLFRLSSQHKPFASHKKPVLLTPGLTHSAASFVVNQAGAPLAFTLADNDYDVWLLNTRGNFLSRVHATLSPSDPKYWDFTSEDIAAKDLPAAIDFVKASSRQAKISYIGHSQGALTLMMLLMKKPQYNASLSVAALLNPSGAHVSLQPSYFKFFLSERTHRVYGYLHWHFVADKPGLGMPRFFARFPTLAAKLYKGRFDISLTGDSAEHLPVYASHFGGGTSLKNMKFLGQLLSRKDPRFFSFDYGREGNLAAYGSATPPVYNYAEITTKLAIFGAKYDTVLTPHDLDLLLQHLPKDKVVYLEKDLPLDHFGVIASKEVGYQKALLQVLQEHA